METNQPYRSDEDTYELLLKEIKQLKQIMLEKINPSNETIDFYDDYQMNRSLASVASGIPT